MSSRVPLRRRRFLSVGSVLGNGFRTWVRDLPVAFMVVVLSGVLPLLGATETYEPSVPDSDAPVNMAVTAYVNTTAVTWLIAVLNRFGRFGFHNEAIFFGAVSLAACYAGTGLLASLLYSRRTAGVWRGTSFPALLRLFAFAVLAAFLLVVAKAALIGVATVMYFVAPYLLIAVTILEAWLVSRCWLVVPILAIERVPMGTALRRSLSLTRGSGFAIFGVVASLAVLTWAVLAVLRVLFTGELGPTYGFGLGGLLLTTIQGAMLAEGYRHLRELREGPDEHSVAAVFE